MTTTLSPEQTRFLSEAARYLENRSYLMRVAGLIGQPVELLARRVLPEKVLRVSNSALRKTMDLAAGTVTDGSNGGQSGEHALWPVTLHTLATAVTGSVGGAFGLAGLALELPITTGIMFRSIASIADAFGEDLKDPAIRLECLTVFGHTGPSTNPMETTASSYLATRTAMAAMVHEATVFLSRNAAQLAADALARESTPALINLVAAVATRFNVVVSEKVLVQSVPLIGALTGAAVNTAFSDHFNTVARYHFGIRQLERREGTDRVQAAYLQEIRRIQERR
jgi:EcsC protein family